MQEELKQFLELSEMLTIARIPKEGLSMVDRVLLFSNLENKPLVMDKVKWKVVRSSDNPNSAFIELNGIRVGRVMKGISRHDPSVTYYSLYSFHSSRHIGSSNSMDGLETSVRDMIMDYLMGCLGYEPIEAEVFKWEKVKSKVDEDAEEF